MSTEPSQELPSVAVVGRPNVGKSTLFNRIVGRREAIVEEKPGVTRDRKEVVAEWQGREFRLVDTGGWMPGGDSLDAKVSAQSEKAIEEADCVLFVVDTVIGITEEDSRIANILRRNGRPVLVVVNKVDDTNRENSIWEFVRLGVGDPYPVSALHGRGTGDLLEDLVKILPAVPEVESDADAAPADKIFSVSIVGRPNVGKSTLFNRLIGDDRSVVHDMPGTTRDAVDTVVETEDGPVRFVDTAGMRRRSKIDEGTEYYSLVRALQAIDRSDVALLVIDSTVGVTAQDQRLAERVDAAGCPVVVVMNKWELLDADARDEVGYQISQRLHFIGDSPVLKLSALTGKGVHRLLPALAGTIDDALREQRTRAGIPSVSRAFAA
jgi:GTP-binding protein